MSIETETAPTPEPTGNEEAHINKAQALGIITQDDLVVGEPEAVAEEPAPEPEEEIQIGERTFGNRDEALEYAKQLEQERLAADAYRQGLADAANQQKGNLPQAAQPAPDNFEQEFYENPKDYISKQVKQAEDSAYERAMQEINQKNQVNELWTKFYNDYPDLKSKDKLVKTILNEHWNTLGHMPDTGKAMKILAGKTKEQLKVWADEGKPATTLSNAPATVTPGNQSGVTRKLEPEKPLGMVAQLRQHQDKRMGSA